MTPTDRPTSRTRRLPRAGRPLRAALAATAALTAVAVLAGCSSTGGKRAEEEQRRASGAQSAVDTPRWKVAMVTHSGEGDTYWDIVRSGAQQAADKDNIEFLYSHDDEAGRQAELVRTAINQDVDGLIVTLAKPDAMESAVRAAVEAGIPVITVNSGQDLSAGFGALAHIGQDEQLAGEAVGEELNDRGASAAVCVLHEQGNIGHEQRCDGIRTTFDGSVESLYVDGTNMPAVESAIEAKLISGGDVDTVVTLGAPFATVAAKAASQAGSDARTVTFDLNPEVATALQEGTIDFAVDQQPYLQGYQSVDLLWLWLSNGNMLGGGQPVLTGPQIVTPDQAEDLVDYARRGTR
ncbi:sugar ABC transporter substrate-binding protein [Streptomyces bohaiensis]|uniref:Sugar ABC transporter substrate-binding protein n=1 Tax=Streptomyces bohaiensis TaxID=1431344 RepID=A0ABX1C6D3_9ACTN|nr:sugar ABC transporter substrate-binding protein [Streptomyces bohaiensis]